MVQVSDTQAMTISAEAVTHLRSNDPIPIPGDRLTQEYADQLNAQLEAQNGPFLERLRASLGLRVRERTIGGTRVVVITPRTVRRKRRKVAGFWVHGGGFALLSGRDYTAYRMAHDLGIVVYSVDYRRSPRAQFPVALDQTARVHRAVLRDHRTGGGVPRLDARGPARGVPAAGRLHGRLRPHDHHQRHPRPAAE
jgi:acetyl esterase/lipase